MTFQLCNRLLSFVIYFFTKTKGDEWPLVFVIDRLDKTLEDVIYKVVPELQESKEWPVSTIN